MQIKKLTPALAPCVECGHEYAGTVCPVCKAENPTFTAIKNIGQQEDQADELSRLSMLAGEVC